MNIHEIRSFMDVVEVSAEVWPYLQYLQDWVDIVQANSDGWAYWTAGRDVGVQLAHLLRESARGVNVAQSVWDRAIHDIEAVAKAQEKHGNTVPFPVLRREAAPEFPQALHEFSRWLAERVLRRVDHRFDSSCEHCRDKLNAVTDVIQLWVGKRQGSL